MSEFTDFFVTPRAKSLQEARQLSRGQKWPKFEQQWLSYFHFVPLDTILTGNPKEQSLKELDPLIEDESSESDEEGSGYMVTYFRDPLVAALAALSENQLVQVATEWKSALKASGETGDYDTKMILDGLCPLAQAAVEPGRMLIMVVACEY